MEYSVRQRGRGIIREKKFKVHSEAVVDTLRYPLPIHYNFTNPPHWTETPAPRARTFCTLTGIFRKTKEVPYNKVINKGKYNIGN